MSKVARLTAIIALALAAPAAAEPTHVVEGAGYGHGVGFSQYGAYGFAEHGEGWKGIARHYFEGTEMGEVEPTKLRILLQASRQPSVSLERAKRIGGEDVDPGETYVATRDGSSAVTVTSASGRLVGRFSKPANAKPAGDALRLLGSAMNGVSSGSYRGKIELRPGSAGGITAINIVKTEDYLRGVVPNEMPASWPAAAIKAQAAVARGYALSTSLGGVFDHYPDSRSQVYRGVGSEHPATDDAVAATAGRVLRYEGEIAQTFFFSTSGGRTENVENSFYGGPVPYLTSVEDPYDDASPLHRWTRTFSQAEMESRLAGYFDGDFERIEVLERGASPRIVSARVWGSAGSSVVRGTTLQYRLGLPDTWADFDRVSSKHAAAATTATAPMKDRAVRAASPPPKPAPSAR